MSMDTISLTDLGTELLAAAHEASSGRAARTVFGGREHDLRQTVIALAGGRSLGEHDSPGEATLQMLAGNVRLTAGEESWSLSAGDLVAIPPSRHDLHAEVDAVVLLSVAARA